MKNAYIHYSWKEFDEDIDDLARAILAKTTPDLIIGVLRGGAIPATALAHRLDLPLEMVHWQTRTNAGDRDYDKVENLAASGKNILWVDDIVDSGRTFTEIHKIVKMVDNSRFYFAALWYNTNLTICMADFWARPINRNEDKRWVIFPWEESCKQ